FLLIGRESHVGVPFDGIDANLLAAELIRVLSMNDELCDVARGQSTPPPVTLHATDLKAHYDVQIPFMAYFYLNVLTFSTQPGELLARLRQRAQAVLERTLRRIDAAERRWVRTSGDPVRQERLEPCSGTVLTYAGLYAEVGQQLGEKAVGAELASAWESFPGGLDARERCLHLVRRLWTLSGKQGPALVIYYAPPYYPHVAATPCLLHAAIQELDLPVVNLGPYGAGVHQLGERALMSYSFGILPQLLYEVIERLGQQ